MRTFKVQGCPWCGNHIGRYQKCPCESKKTIPTPATEGETETPLIDDITNYCDAVPIMPWVDAEEARKVERLLELEKSNLRSLAGRLGEFSDHKSWCDFATRHDSCDCGFKEVEKALAELEEARR